MRTRPCRDDPLMHLLNARGYHPIVLPRADVVPPDIYVFDNQRLKRWGRLAKALPPGSLTASATKAAMPDIVHVQTSEKGAKGAASFLESALKAIGVSGAPRVDLSMATGRAVTFSFKGVSSQSLDVGIVAAALQKGFEPAGLPPDQLQLGMVHVAYDYAYASELLMRIGGETAGQGRLTAAQVEGIVELSAEASAKVVDGTTISFSGRNDAVAFACKVGQVKRRKGGGWDFYNDEVPGIGAGPNEAAPTPYLMRRGEILIVEDLDL